MAKQKKQKLYCDEVADCNIRLINKCGEIINADKLVPIIADDYTAQALQKGLTIEQTESMVKEQLLSSQSMSQMSSLTALNNWYWGGRQVYRFDEELTALLCSQTKDDISIDKSALSLLPINHFYISLENETTHGFFVSISDNVLYISDMQNDHTESYALTIPSEITLLSEIIENANKLMGITVSKKQTVELSKKISMYMQFIVYLSAVNAEITPITNGAVVARQAGQKQFIRHDKTEISDVGYRLGNAIRESRKEKPNIQYIGEHSHGSPKSPHIRRSHFHSYWTGSGDDKELIVKWVNTIFVHGNNTNVSTVHDVKQDTEQDT